MKTNKENFKEMKSQIITNIQGMPDTLKILRDWDEVEVDVTEAKREAIAAIAAKDTFTPAFTPVQNVTGVFGVSELAVAVIDAAAWEVK